MITPVMMKVDFASVKNAGKRPAGLVFGAFITPAEADQYIAGCIIPAAAPYTAMVFVWSRLTKGDAAYTLVQVHRFVFGSGSEYGNRPLLPAGSRLGNPQQVTTHRN